MSSSCSAFDNFYITICCQLYVRNALKRHFCLRKCFVPLELIGHIRVASKVKCRLSSSREWVCRFVFLAAGFAFGACSCLPRASLCNLINHPRPPPLCPSSLTWHGVLRGERENSERLIKCICSSIINSGQFTGISGISRTRLHLSRVYSNH